MIQVGPVFWIIAKQSEAFLKSAIYVVVHLF